MFHTVNYKINSSFNFKDSDYHKIESDTPGINAEGTTSALDLLLKQFIHSAEHSRQ